MLYGLHNFERSKQNLGSNTPLDKLLLFRRTYPRSGKNGNRLAYPKAVSYTHLDVYKRQILDRLSGRSWKFPFLNNSAGRWHFLLWPLDCLPAKAGGAVNGCAYAPFILTVDWLGWRCV